MAWLVGILVLILCVILYVLHFYLAFCFVDHLFGNWRQLHFDNRLCTWTLSRRRDNRIAVQSLAEYER